MCLLKRARWFEEHLRFVDRNAASLVEESRLADSTAWQASWMQLCFVAARACEGTECGLLGGGQPSHTCYSCRRRCCCCCDVWS